MNRPRIEPHFGPDDRPGILITTPFNETFIEQVKTLPRGDRRWWEGTGWWVAEAHADVAEHFVRSIWPEIDVVDEDGHVTTVTADGSLLRQETLFR